MENKGDRSASEIAVPSAMGGAVRLHEQGQRPSHRRELRPPTNQVPLQGAGAIRGRSGLLGWLVPGAERVCVCVCVCVRHSGCSSECLQAASSRMLRHLGLVCVVVFGPEAAAKGSCAV